MYINKITSYLPYPYCGQNFGYSLWSRSMILGSTKVQREAVKLFSKYSDVMWLHDTSTSQTHGRFAIAIPRSAWHCAVKKIWEYSRS